MILRNLMPVPVSVAAKAGEFHFGAEATLRVNAPLLTEGMIEEYKGLWNRYGMRKNALRVVRDERLQENCAVLCAAENDCPALGAGDEYALTVTEKGAFVRGESAVGLLHGLFTLVQLVVPVALDDRPDYALPAVEIHDHPAIAGMRAIHLCVFPETTLILLEKAIRLAGMMKFTHVVLEFWGTLRYEALPELAWPKHAYSKEQIRPLVRLIQNLGMEVIPMLNHLGHAAQCRSCYGKHVVLDQNPGRALLFEPDGWTWCISNPETRRVLRALRQELIELCGSGKYFHLGCDESYSYATCPICSGKDTRKLLADYLNELTGELAAQGRRPIIWGDQLLDTTVWKHPNIATSRPDQRTHEALPLLDRRIVIADWQYSLTEPKAPTMEHFMQHGFDTVICPWDGHGNNEAMGEAADRAHAFGFMATTWDHLPEYLRLMPTVAGSCWNGADFSAEKRGQCSWTELATMLRKVMPQLPEYHNAGWIGREVLEFDDSVRRHF